MMREWPCMTTDEIDEALSEALATNLSYRDDRILGLPGSRLNSALLERLGPASEQPLMRALIENPNHIGCHTRPCSETVFAGTQDLERKCIDLCAEGILGAERGTIDGYISSGGTESNIQALWTFRNFFRSRYDAREGQVAVLYSADTHYSVAKGCDILGLEAISIPVDECSRQMKLDVLESAIRRAQSRGTRCFVVVVNLGTTMFGSVDDVDAIAAVVEARGAIFRVHVDAAFGGFLFPFVDEYDRTSFENHRVDSVSLDAHKLLGTPYGTGVFLIRKGYLDAVCTRDAGYVPGLDHTLCGSRSGVSALSLWIVLSTYGSEGWREHCRELLERTDHLCRQLDELGISYFRERSMNLVAIRAGEVSPAVVRRHLLVPDAHDRRARWIKVVVMDHVTRDRIDDLVADLAESARLRHKQAA